MKKILTFGRYTKKKFGQKVYKVPISISGFTCPNIDGKTAVGGCTFCENDSFSPNLNQATPLDTSKKFYLNMESKSNPHLELQLKQLTLQFNALSKQLAKTHGAKKFMVYFQSFTNTYAPLDTLKALYEKALSFKNVVGLSIGTRTDSITQETLDYLATLNETHEIWIEYGIQSVYDETLTAINRGHDIANVKKWIAKTKATGLYVCGHLIFGLPGETKEMMLHSFRESLTYNIDSIKFHPQYVVKKTALANDFKKGIFTPITQEAYADVLTRCMIELPKNIVVQRLTAGIDDDSLLGPMWCKNKNSSTKYIKQVFKQENILY